MVICLEQSADLYMAQLMPLPRIVFCFRKIQIGFTFLVPAHMGSPGKGPLNGCVCVKGGLESICCWNVLQRVRQFVRGLWNSKRQRTLSEFGNESQKRLQLKKICRLKCQN